MKVVITGGAGFLGNRLAGVLAKRGRLVGPSGKDEAIDEIVLFDITVAAKLPTGVKVRSVAGDVADAKQVRMVIDGATGSIFHLAAVVSGGAELDFDLGWRVNLDGMRTVLEAARSLGTKPRLVFTSSVAVFGGVMPPVVTDETALTPQTSYGAQKAAGELMVSDYSRKGFIDGRSVRLPTITVRPGKPNLAASSFASGIIREPLTGVETNCPVPRETLMPLMSPRKVMEAFVKAHDVDAGLFGASRSMTLPGLTASVQEMVEAMGRVAGPKPVARLGFKIDPVIDRIVKTWPVATDSKLARQVGIVSDATVDDIVRAFIEDDLDGKPVL
jgi:nucleoside-diphosphate-sugar epimerase